MNRPAWFLNALFALPVLIFFALRLGIYALLEPFFSDRLGSRVSALRFALVRVLLGALVGGLLAVTFIGAHVGNPAVWYLTLAPIRFVVWWTTLRFVYGFDRAASRAGLGAAGAGVAFSYAIDLVVVGLGVAIGRSFGGSRFPFGC